MKRAILILAGGSFLAGILYLAATWRYPLGSARQPGPGLYPLLVAALLLVASVGTAWEAKSVPAGTGLEWPTRAGRWRIAAILAAILGYILLLPNLGHPVASGATTLLSLQALGGLRWATKIILAVVLGLGSYYLFNTLLGVPLPRGRFL